MDKYTLLKDDLDELISTYENNPNITGNQRKIWFKDGKKAAITRPNFGKYGVNNPKPLRLLKEDGFNGDTVGSRSGRAAKGFWDSGSFHIFPPVEDLVRIGIFFGLDLYSSAALALKGMWEYFYAHEIHGYRANCGHNLTDILKYTDEHEVKRANNNFTSFKGFKKQIKEIFSTLECHKELVTQAGYTEDTFNTMIHNMLKKEFHWKNYSCPEIVRFASEENYRIKMLKEGSAEERETFWMARMTWNQSHSDLDDIYFRIENIRLKQSKIERKWLCIFGTLEVEMQQAIFECKNLERRLLIMQANPGMALTELDLAVEKEEARLEKELRQSRQNAHLAISLEQVFGNDSVPMSMQKIDDYQKKCKQLIRRIYQRIHPDKLKNHPGYERLTEKQKEELQQFLLACLEPDNLEKAVPEGFLNSDMRTPSGLQRVLDRIDIILEMAGIDIKADTTITGDTIKEQLEWLNRDIAFVEKRLEEGLAHLRAMQEDHESARKDSLLEQKEKHEHIKEEMREEINRHTKRAEEMSLELIQYFKEEY
jgi:hypothetical protein